MQRVAEDFLVEPFNVAKVEAGGPGWEEQPKELGEELLQQSLEPRIVHRSLLLAKPMARRVTHRAPLQIREIVMIQATAAMVAIQADRRDVGWDQTAERAPAHHCPTMVGRRSPKASLSH
ncbi:MAG TPA: hypothetical protein VGX76_23135, partial [Pirellulales bacterium]|nr:hypothetical protein [Pirellulales bacterium]